MTFFPSAHFFTSPRMIFVNCADVTLPTALSLFTITAVWCAKQGVRVAKKKGERTDSKTNSHDSTSRLFCGGNESLANQSDDCCHENVTWRTEVIEGNPII